MRHSPLRRHNCLDGREFGLDVRFARRHQSGDSSQYRYVGAERPDLADLRDVGRCLVVGKDPREMLLDAMGRLDRGPVKANDAAIFSEQRSEATGVATIPSIQQIAVQGLDATLVHQASVPSSTRVKPHFPRNAGGSADHAEPDIRPFGRRCPQLDRHTLGIAHAPIPTSKRSPAMPSKPPAKATRTSVAKAAPRRSHGSKDPDAFDVGSGGETHQRREQGEAVLTTAQGTPISDDQNSLKVGERGPTLMNDFVLREKVFHFDHERIPERVVHARGFGAHGFFENFEGLSDLTRADLFQRRGQRTPVFVRFSTVAGNKGSADLARDVRGFAVKFYTRQGNWDLVGNNIPVFFIQDAIKFPDFIHSVKANPIGASRSGFCARQLLGLRVARAGIDAHVDVGDVGPGDPQVVPVHGGLRGAHVPLCERRRAIQLRQVPLEAEARHAICGVERSGEDQRRRPRLPPAGPVELHSDGCIPRMGARPAALR